MPPRPVTLDQLARTIQVRREALDPCRALLVGISGIDGSGKGWVAGRLEGTLREAGLRAITLNADAWLNLPSVRFGGDRPGEHFYDHALRLNDFVLRLLRPLQAGEAVDLVADAATETGAEFGPHRYVFDPVDVVLAEGILLFKTTYRSAFDLAIWVDCGFETALERAVARAQEGLTPEATVRAYQTIYFPAQLVHIERDAPKDHADCLLVNDPRLTG